MKYRSLLSFFILAFGLIGCGSPPSADPKDYVGEYVFRPANTEPGKFASFLILEPNNEVIEIRFDKGSGQLRTTQTKWYLSRGTGQNVVIGDFSCPVEGSRSAIKLGLNDDLGQYYEKVR